MAFDITRFGSDSSNVKSILDGVRYYRYFNKDNNTLTTPGYFPADLGLNVGDRIAVVPSTKTNADELYIVTSVANRVVTVTQVDTDGLVDSVNGKTGAVVLDATDVGAQETLVSGTNIKTINGESILGDGNLTINAGGIDWKTKVDLPADFKPDNWSVSPIFTIEGGLPDGEYEMYLQTQKRGAESGSTRVFGLATYIFRFRIDNTSKEYIGWFAPVIDGNWGGSAEQIYAESRYLYSVLYYNNDNDIIITGSESVFVTDLHGAYNVSVDDCFKLSAIKNVDTGDEYVATGELYDNQDTGTQFNGYLMCKPLQEAPTITTYYTSTTINDLQTFNGVSISGIFNSNGELRQASEVSISLALGTDVFNAKIQMFANDYELTVQDATGVFANTQVGLMRGTVNSIYVYWNLPGGTTGVIKCVVGWIGANKDYGHNTNAAYIDTNLFVPLNVLKVGVTPASVNYLGKIMQYTGTTDANYTNGHFYKATGTVVTVPQALTAYDIAPNDVSITIDVGNLITAIQNLTGWTADNIKSYFNEYPQWQIQYDWDNSTVTTVYWGAYGDLTDASILSCFTVSTTGSYSGTTSVSFYATYTAESQTVSGGAWEHINVDSIVALLESVTGYDATKNQTLKNTAGVISWVDD